ncbi:LuxR family transcriptional regulator [Rhizobium sp. 32-5/1]|uniref:helix-turn-helix transcriptional regulator n=1 Tax=Rhizobium sp. 32-5/1 TaxID=3019602 RepID=UPI00240E0028|nr:LuxR family transcriptional regulator [Rhizobium sp. 32-5/1]WEZ82040.1 LuxR family transcriptional regulator [Rhizobium sp. 32-5/1]
MNISLLVQFMALMDEMKTRNEIVAEFERVLDRYGFDFYGIVRQPKPNEDPLSLLLAGRWPEGWPEIYISKKYVIIDPTIRYLGHAQRGFRWRDTLVAFRSDPHRKRMERMMVEARGHKLHDGYIFPVHGRRGLMGNLTIGGRVVDLSSVEMALFDSIAKKIFWKLLELTDPAILAELVSSVDVQMTRREMEALNYLADGMTSHEISRILDISNHTVDWYMNGIQEKLKAKNRHHVVALAFRLGLIS